MSAYAEGERTQKCKLLQHAQDYLSRIQISTREMEEAREIIEPGKEGRQEGIEISMPRLKAIFQGTFITLM